VAAGGPAGRGGEAGVGVIVLIWFSKPEVFFLSAGMAELADAADSKSAGA
jgi:hypothetical protein